MPPLTRLRKRQDASLPPEIINLIIDELNDDRQALRSCSLVNRAWYPRTRDHLFSMVLLMGGSPQRCCKQLLQLVRRRPRLAQSVRGLLLGVFTPSVLAHLLDPFSKVPINGWLQQSQEIEPLLKRLTRIRNISLIGIPMALAWGVLPSTLKGTLYEVFSRPTTESILLNNIAGIQITPFAQYAHLRTIHLEFLELDPSDTPDKLAEQRIAEPGLQNLESITLSSPGEAWDTLLTCVSQGSANISFSGVKLVQVTTEDWDEMMDSVWDRLVGHCKGSLESLSIIHDVDVDGAGSQAPYPMRTLELSPFTSLTRLYMKTNLFGLDVEGQDFTSHFLEGLRQLSTQPNSLETVAIDIGYYHPDNDEGPHAHLVDFLRGEFVWNFWTELDEVLTSTRFPKLQPVVIGCQFADGAMYELLWRRMVNVFREQMPRLSKERLLCAVPIGKLILCSGETVTLLPCMV